MKQELENKEIFENKKENHNEENNKKIEKETNSNFDKNDPRFEQFQIANNIPIRKVKKPKKKLFT
jgi:hypothetical protein